MTTSPKIYLGDGAYVEWNGWAFIITTNNGIESTNEIYLEPEHIAALIRFAKIQGVTCQ